MSSDNPASAIKAFLPKTYKFKGKKVQNSNLAMIALEQCGIPLHEMMKSTSQAGAIIAWTFTAGADEVVDALADGSAKKKAFKFASTLTTEEFGEAIAIFTDCVKRFNDSITNYFNPASKGKNTQTA